MATKIRWETGGIGMVAAHIESEDGGTAFVFCGLGGTPQFQLDRNARTATPIANAPTCETFGQFKAFVAERFGDVR